MAYNYSERIGHEYRGGNNLKSYGLKESFNERLAANFRAENQQSIWTFGVIFANCVLLVVSVGLGVLAFLLRQSWQQYAPFLDAYLGTPYFALQIAAGALCACSLLSIAPLSLRSHGFILMYGFVFLILMVLQIGLLVYWLLGASTDVQTEVGASFRLALQDYENNTVVKDEVDNIQKSLLCCGADEIEDWFDTVTNALPHSCCWLRPSSGEHNCLNVDMLYVQIASCVPMLQEIPLRGIKIVYAVTGSLILIQATVVLLSWRAGRLIRHHERARSKPYTMDPAST